MMRAVYGKCMYVYWRKQHLGLLVKGDHVDCRLWSVSTCLHHEERSGVYGSWILVCGQTGTPDDTVKCLGACASQLNDELVQVISLKLKTYRQAHVYRSTDPFWRKRTGFPSDANIMVEFKLPRSSSRQWPGITVSIKWTIASICCQSPSTVFTALHAMQTRSSDENSVCPSVRPSICLPNAWIVTKRKKDLSRFLYHIYERSFRLVFCEEKWLVGATLEILGQQAPVGAKSPILSRYSLVAPQP